MQPLRPPTVDFLKSLYALPKGSGNSDFIEAVTVAANAINKAIQARPGAPTRSQCVGFLLIGLWQWVANERVHLQSWRGPMCRRRLC